MIARAWHRIRQFFGALRPRVTESERADAYHWLEPAEQALFETMMVRDQQHGVIVLRRVRASSPDEDRALFAAALLHDCGKGHVGLWQRVMHVAAPWAESKLARQTGAEWRQAFWRLRYHPDIGADMAQQAGSSAETIRLIRKQEAKAADPRLALLQAADDA
jgi:HD domain